MLFNFTIAILLVVLRVVQIITLTICFTEGSQVIENYN